MPKMLILRDIGKRVPCYLHKCQMFYELAALVIELFTSKDFFLLKAMLVTVQSDHYDNINKQSGIINSLIQNKRNF